LLPLELLMHAAGKVGIIPRQMTFTGAKLDILTGASAVIVGPLIAWRVVGVRATRMWDWMGAIVTTRAPTGSPCSR
jgi:hypothetical protein